MNDRSWKYYAAANVAVLAMAMGNSAWSQDPVAAATQAVPSAPSMPSVPSAPSVPGVPAAVAVPKDADARDRATAACMNEAKARGAKLGAVDVSMAKVEDTDKYDDGRAAMRAKVDVAMRDKDGKVKIKKMTIRCETRHDVVTSFKYED